jgi:hypothetical protein
VSDLNAGDVGDRIEAAGRAADRQLQIALARLLLSSGAGSKRKGGKRRQRQGEEGRYPHDRYVITGAVSAGSARSWTAPRSAESA